MFLILFDALQEFLLFTDVDKKLSLSQDSAIGDPLIDANNNDLPTITTCDIKQRDFSTETTKDLGMIMHLQKYKTSDFICNNFVFNKLLCEFRI